MPTLLRKNGFKFFFYANDHPPAHIHITKGDAWARIELSNTKVLYSTLKVQELKEATLILIEYREKFLEAWNEWFNGKKSTF